MLTAAMFIRRLIYVLYRSSTEEFSQRGSLRMIMLTIGGPFYQNQTPPVMRRPCCDGYQNATGARKLRRRCGKKPVILLRC